ncbi:uncharacterized protein B0H18DRAFT_1112711 [Fomitopsis serialis]|uniref:uncharacterized protein n=1 Tax=Fomitopsis serialis TaxID=139415 RepID=UPI0020089ED6|nr:uncharacterized protein B0H18DRAFT_1112711 [Neoantrodia serialis]KAH9938572.1 hypothetical protein B0H18DRAFT_1112711 [Neoantrodia serialis]
MMSLIRSRAPTLILFGSIQTAMWSWVYMRWQQPSEIKGPLPSHIPKGFMGRARFRQQHAPFASGYATY